MTACSLLLTRRTSPVEKLLAVLMVHGLVVVAFQLELQIKEVQQILVHDNPQ